MACTEGATEFEALSNADIVIETVFEDMAVKHEVFKTLDRVCKPGAILASNTSYLDIDRIASVTARPEDVVGMHFFSPATVLLAIVCSASARAKAISCCRRAPRPIRSWRTFVLCRPYRVGHRSCGRTQIRGPTRLGVLEAS